MRKSFLAAPLPGAALVVLSLLGLVPTARDGPSYFVPLRHHTAQVLKGVASPWLNEAVGCGEPFFANPQSALLYPPGWSALVFSPERAVGVEVGLHLAFLGLGIFQLCRRLGGRPLQALATAWGGQLSGPMLSAAGMLNNLETAAWLPWIWWASLGQRPRLLAVLVALSFFAAEPTLALGGALIALWLAPRWLTAKALALGLGLASVQWAPMAYWIITGNRGPNRPLEAVGAGGIPLGELPALFVPGLPLPQGETPFLPVITIPTWVLLGFWSLRAASSPHRRLFLASLAFLAVSVLPTLPWGDVLWLAISFGLVRLPGRFAIVASLGFLVWAGSQEWPRRKAWVVISAGLGLLGLMFSRQPVLAVTQAVASGMAPWLQAGALLGSTSLALTTIDVLALARWTPQAVPCLKAQANHRVFPLPAARDQFQWALDHGPDGPLQLAWGYSVLLDGRRMVRSHAPLQNRLLSSHLAEADKGPSASWWVSALGASRLLTLHPLPGYPVVCREGGLVVLANPSPFPLWGLVAKLPNPGETPTLLGKVTLVTRRGDSWQFLVKTPEAGVFLWLFTPDSGWSFRVDGDELLPQRGVGILQGVPVPAGEHMVVIRYRPTGLFLGLLLSLASLVGVVWRRWW